jgi:hypothetical protein
MTKETAIMFKNLFSRDLPAAKAYHAAKLNARGDNHFAETVLEASPRKSQEELNLAIDRYSAAIRAQMQLQAPVRKANAPV